MVTAVSTLRDNGERRQRGGGKGKEREGGEKQNNKMYLNFHVM